MGDYRAGGVDGVGAGGRGAYWLFSRDFDC